MKSASTAWSIRRPSRYSSDSPVATWPASGLGSTM
ncbi:Uncharacterised protein [Bordetella pertussis]|nr:Uncharacterised protein [Bordetella pertussis]CFP59908.1 Uncharacterised protein [Bordetella pertussis]